MYKAILFDFDGTTLDTETPECASWQEIYTHHGIEFPIDAFHAAVGKGYDQTVFEPAFYLSEAIGASDLYEEIRAEQRRIFYEMLHALDCRRFSIFHSDMPATHSLHCDKLHVCSRQFRFGLEETSQLCLHGLRLDFRFKVRTDHCITRPCTITFTNRILCDQPLRPYKRPCRFTTFFSIAGDPSRSLRVRENPCKSCSLGSASASMWRTAPLQCSSLLASRAQWTFEVCSTCANTHTLTHSLTHSLTHTPHTGL